MDGQSRDDALIGALAGSQHGVVTRSQLLDAGVGRGAIEHRIAAGRLLPMHRGVYAVGHMPVTREAAWLAAVFACGVGALLSHRSAGALWGVRRWAPARPEVTTSTQRRRPGIAVHVRRTTDAERDVHLGIPVTSLARTIVDLAHTLEVDELERVVREADFQRRLDVSAVRASLVRRPSQRWSISSTGGRRPSRATRIASSGCVSASGCRRHSRSSAWADGPSTSCGLTRD